MAVLTLLVLTTSGGLPPQLDRLPPGTEIVRADCEPERLAAQLAEADVLLVWDFATDLIRTAWPAEGPVPAWVHTASAGVDRLIFPALVESPTVLTNARGIFEQPIAEYVAGLVLAMAKDFHGTWELQRQHRWQHRETLRVAGTKALIVGAGPIGRAIGRTLALLGIAVDLIGRTERESDPEFGRVHAVGSLAELLPQADWVVCAAPLTEQTRGMFGTAAFARMKPSARLINVGRGPLVVGEELVDALLERRIAGAALDVFEHEPLPEDHRMWEVPGLIISPHMSADTLGWRDNLAEQFLDNYARWVGGRPLLNVVDKRLGYVPVS
jgi:phosphoglycerate dehydrogenase-like enzyme